MAIGERTHKTSSSTPIRRRTCQTPGYPVLANHGQGFFDGNPYQWQDEADLIKYALSKLKGSQGASFAMTYRNQITREVGHIPLDGYELWDVFAEQAIP